MIGGSSADAGIPCLDDVERSIQAFDPELVRRALWPALKNKAARTCREQLLHATGVWYEAGPRVGDESVRGWCWCHSFAQPGTPDERWAGVLQELRHAITWRTTMIAAVRQVTDLERPEQVVLDLLQHQLGLGIHDAWYVHLDAPLAWLLDHLGLARTDVQVTALYLAAEARFTSWVEPDGGSRRAFASDVAWQLVEQQLDATNR